MARLPSKIDLGGLPSARSGRPIASFDESAVGAGVANLGKGVAGLGKGISEALALEQERDADSWFIKARAEAGEYWASRMPKAKVEAGEGAPGFVNAISGEYDSHTERMLASAPSDRARKLYSDWSTIYGSRVKGDAAGFAVRSSVALRDSRYRDAFEAHKREVYSDPASLKRVTLEAGDDLAGMERDLPPEVLTKHRERMARELAEAAVLGLMERKDYDGARALTGTGNYTERAFVAEGTGKNPLSSAEGYGGFTEGTWIEWFNKTFPDEKMMRKEKKLALRHDRDRAAKVMQNFTSANRKILSNNEIPINNGSLYALHLFGAGDGPKVLKASADTPIEDIVKADKIKANPWMEGKTAGEIRNALARKVGGAGSAIPLDRALKYEAAIDRAEAAHEKAVDTKVRFDTVTDGYDLMREKKLTLDWLSDHKDDLKIGDYKVFSRALNEEGLQKADTGAVEPKEFLRLLSLANDDPEKAKEEVRDLYGSGKIPQHVFLRVDGIADRILKGESRTPTYVKDVRGFVDQFLRDRAKISGGSRSSHERRLNSMFAFDDWVKDHPDANRNDVRRFADDLIDNYREVSKRVTREYLPMPPFIPNVERDTLTVDQLMASRSLLLRMAREGRVSDKEAAEQAKIIKRWMSILETPGGTKK